MRSAFLDTLRCVVAAIGSEAVAARWDDATVVPPYLVGQLLGHMYNTAAATERYLDAEPPVAPPVPSALYFAREPSAEHAAAIDAGIRDRAARVSERGAAALTLDAAALHERLSARLATESDERVVAVMGDIVLTLDGYLQSRIVELIVHLDDLAVTLGTDFQPPRRRSQSRSPTLSMSAESAMATSPCCALSRAASETASTRRAPSSNAERPSQICQRSGTRRPDRDRALCARCRRPRCVRANRCLALLGGVKLCVCRNRGCTMTRSKSTLIYPWWTDHHDQFAVALL